LALLRVAVVLREVTLQIRGSGGHCRVIGEEIGFFLFDAKIKKISIVRAQVFEVTDSVDSVVSDPQILFAHTERDAEDIFDEEEDQRRPDSVPTYDEHRTEKLTTKSYVSLIYKTKKGCEKTPGLTVQFVCHSP
jgi:hypothetical protein